MRFQNTAFAIMSLLISIGFWAYVTSQDPALQNVLPSGSYRLSVDLNNPPLGFIVPSEKPRIYVRADGTNDEIDKLQKSMDQDPTQLEASVDLSKATVGENKYPIRVQIPKGFEGMKWRYPKEVTLFIDQRKTRVLTVQVEPIGIPPEGFISDHQETDPKTVTIEGNASEIDKIDHARVVLDLSKLQLNEAMVGTVQLLGKNDVPLLLTPTPAKVTILAQLSIKPSASKLLVSPVIIGQPAPGFKVLSIEATPNQVVFRGPSEVLARTTTVDTKPIDISGVKENKTFEAELQVIDQLHPAKNAPVRVRVLIGPVGIPTTPTPINTPPPTEHPTQ